MSMTNTTNTAGRTVIEDAVVEKVAGIAARQVPGVFALGGGTARAIGAVRDAIGQRDHGQGIKVEVGERQVAADVVIVAEYPVPLQRLADDVRSSVSRALEQIVGMAVVEVNVTVQDVHMPEDDADDAAETESRVS
ncbi:Asp23/Gls24 family envelope stress response protein [Microbacterium sp. M1A1_1b]|uniref:Asp23/Gls24 family envelope stress response protein n=1 Tax=Curtobacterium sp. VKM Ac-2922 TaxID=2929475 RepID=UPI001FB28B6F|nr:Asp23/Gls24 family envelope stress response protein [Curtobacterium sp. VKM Ac-2922]MCJ1714777.1 Asp23/Gls24 family envelope stress response protein [Curtobacterium sp. VKM Ac-2922]